MYELVIEHVLYFLLKASLKVLILLPIPRLLSCCMLDIKASSRADCVTPTSSKSLKLLPILGEPSLPDFLYLGLSFSSSARYLGLSGPGRLLLSWLLLFDGGGCAELPDEAEESGGGILTFDLLVVVVGCGSTFCRFGEFRRVAEGSSLVGFAVLAKGKKPPGESSSSSSASPSELKGPATGFLLS